MEQDPAQPDRPANGDASEHPVTPVPRAAIPEPLDPSTVSGPGSDTHEAGSGRKHDRNRTSTAVILIVVGAVLLAGQTFGASLDNWWALFILIPAITAMSSAWRAYQKHDGELTSDVTGPGITGIILLVLTGVFLFDLDWSLMGGIIVILIGASMLARNRSKG